MITIQWVVYMVVGSCACFGVLFLLFSFMTKQMAKQKETEKTSAGKSEESEDE